jgi:hypothetical protein
MGSGLGWAGRPGPIQAQLAASFAWCRFPSLLDASPSACRSMSLVSLRVGRSSLSHKIQHFSGQVLGVCHLLGLSPWLLGVKFASSHGSYGLQGLVTRCLMNLSLKSCIQR